MSHRSRWRAWKFSFKADGKKHYKFQYRYKVRATQKSGVKSEMEFAKNLRALVVTLSVSLTAVALAVTVPEEVSAYTPHSPIYIDGNGAFIPANGVTAGIGTPLDPYVIEGWEINASTADGISVRNTNAHLIIRDVYVHSGSESWNGGILLHNVSNVRVENSTVLDTSTGIAAYYSESIAVLGNNASKGNTGIESFSSNNITIVDNYLYSNDQNGIYPLRSANISVSGNTAVDNWYGIRILWSNNSTVTNNYAYSNYWLGISAAYANNTTIVDNYVSSNGFWGIYYYDATNTTAFSNVMIENGILMWGKSIEHWDTHNIDTSNTVNGKPVYYWKNVIGGSIPLGAGEVILANCSGVVVENQNLSDGTYGIELGFSSYNTLQYNIASGGYSGIYVYRSKENTIAHNIVSSNLANGIELVYSWNNTLANNMISLHDLEGLSIGQSEYNIVTNNTLYDNYLGVFLSLSPNNTFYHNNFIDNTGNAFEGNNNSWDNGYPIGGNYWSDYVGVDTRSGINQNLPGSDGFGDSPYDVSSMAKDGYPLMNPLVLPPWAPRNLQANPGDTKVTLSWEPPRSFGTIPQIGYRIYRGTVPGGEMLVAEIGNVLEYSDTGLANGQDYYYEVAGINSGGDGPRSNEANATPVNQPPVCEIADPASGQTISGVYAIIGSSLDSSGVVQWVEVRIDSGPWSIATGNASWSYNWNTTTVSDGEYTLYARSFDGSNYSSEVYVTVKVHNPPSNEPPICTISSPIPGATVSSTYTITGTATDPDGTNLSVMIRIGDGVWLEASGNESWSYDWNTTTLENREYTIYARSFDGTDFSTEAQVTVTVNNVPPQEPQDDWIWIVVGVAIVLAVILLALYLLTRRRKKNGEGDQEEFPKESF